MSDIINRAASVTGSSNLLRDYGTGEEYTANEVHILAYIVNNPGITVTQMSYDWDKTKAATSMMLNKLEDKGLLKSSRDSDNLSIKNFYPTDKGLTLHRAHVDYDGRVFKETLNQMAKTLTKEEIDTMFKGLTVLTDVLVNKRYRSDK